MKIILFTQNDPFYLIESTEDFIRKINKNKNHQIIQAIITQPSPFGKNDTFIRKSIKTFRIFGLKFFIFYSIKYILRKIILRKDLSNVFLKYNIPIIKLSSNINSNSNVDKIKKLNADLILIIAGNQIIKKKILNSTKYGVFNVHSSLLPNYKGLMPTFWVLKNNESVTGVTLYKLTEGIDNGPIISQKKINIEKNIPQSKLIKKLKILANDLILNSINLIKDKKNFKYVSGGSYFKFPNKNDVIEFKKMNKKFF